MVCIKVRPKKVKRNLINPSICIHILGWYSKQKSINERLEVAHEGFYTKLSFLMVSWIEISTLLLSKLSYN